jgi:hypothetical protein
MLGKHKVIRIEKNENATGLKTEESGCHLAVLWVVFHKSPLLKVPCSNANALAKTLHILLVRWFQHSSPSSS